jgi:hypothetical protein
MATDPSPAERIRSEFEGLHGEMRRLDAEGRLHDPQVQQALLARSDAIGRHAHDELDAAYARARASVLEVRYPAPMKWWQWAGVGLVLALALGMSIEVTAGQGFIFAGLERWRDLRPWVALIAAPLLLLALVVGERRNPLVKLRYPGAFTRWAVLFPLMVVAGVALLVTAPLGWAAVHARVLGTRVEGLDARLVSVAEARPGSRACRQDGEVEFEGQTATLCLAGRIGGSALHAGDRVKLAGWRSAAGLYVDRIERQPNPPSGR